MNFMGLGFSFGAKDSGLGGVLKDVSTQMDGLAEGVRTFGSTAEQATEPMSNLVNSFAGDLFGGLASGLEHVSSALQGGVFDGILKGSQMMDTAEKAYNAAGEGIGMSFDNVKNSLKGVYQQLVGDRIKKFAEQIPVERFKAVGESIKTSMGAARSFAGRLFGMKQGLDQVGQGAKGAIKPLKAVMNPGSVAGLTAQLADADKAIAIYRKALNDSDTTSQRFFDRLSKAKKPLGDTSHGLKDVAAQNDKVNTSVGSGKLKKFFDSLSGGVSKIKGLGSALSGIATTSGQLTTSTEAAAQAANVGARALIANTGVVGKELNLLSAAAGSLSLSTGLSAQATAKGAVAVAKYGPVLKMWGIDTMATAAKATELYGVDTVRLGQSMESLQKSTGATTKEMEELGKSQMAAGVATKDISGHMAKLDQMTALASRRTVLFKSNISKVGGVGSVKGVNQLTRYLVAAGVDAGKAGAAAIDVEESLVEAGEKTGDMMSGVEKGLADLPVELSIISGDITKAMDLMASDSGAAFKMLAKGFASLSPEAKKSGAVLNFVRSRLKGFKGGTEAVTQALSNMDEKTFAALEAQEKLGETLGHSANEGYRSAKTMQEGFDLMMGSLEGQFREIGRKKVVEFIGNTKTAFETFNRNAATMSARGGPLGLLVNKMSEISSLGSKALLPASLQPMAAIFEKMGPQILQSVQAFGALIPVLMALAGPAGIVLALVAGLAAAYLVFQQVKSNLKNIEPEWKKATSAVSGYEKQLKTLREGTDKYTETMGKLAEARKVVAGLEPIKKLNDEAAASRKVVGATEVRLKQLQHSKDDYDAFSFQLQKLKKTQEALAAAPSTAGGAKAAGANNAAITALEKKLSGLKNNKAQFESLTAVLAAEKKKQADIEIKFNDEAKKRASEAMSAKVKEYSLILQEFIKSELPAVMKTIWPVVKKPLEDLLSEIGFLMVKGIVDIFWSDGHFLGIDWDFLFTKWWNDQKAAFTQIMGFINKDGHFLGIDWGYLADTAAAAITAPFKAFFKWIGDTVDDMFGHSTVPDAFARGFKAIEGTFNLFWGVAKGIFSSVAALAGTMFEPVTKIVDKIFGAGSPDSVAGMISGGMAKAVEVIQEAVRGVVKLVQETLYKAIVEGITSAFVAAFKETSDSSKAFFKAELVLFKSFTNEIYLMFARMWRGILDNVDIATKGAKEAIADSLQDLQKLQTALDQIQSTRAQTAKLDASKPGEKVMLKSGQSVEEAILQQTAHPEWYLAYEGVFMSQMGTLIAAVNGIKGGSVVAGPGKAGAASKASAAVGANTAAFVANTGT
jgi:hypothetical protein